jgi:hypothetical protein
MNLKNITQLLQKTLGLTLIIGSLSLGGISTKAQSYTAPSVSVLEKDFILSITACKLRWDWTRNKYISSVANPDKAPEDSTNCVTEEAAYTNGVAKTDKYTSFTKVGEDAKGIFGNDKVMSIAAQDKATTSSTNLADRTNLNKIFNGTKTSQGQVASLQSIFTTMPTLPTTGGMPRMTWTGADTFTEPTGDSKARTYNGGWCSIENGVAKVRTTRAGKAFSPVGDKNLEGRDTANAESMCAPKGKTTMPKGVLKVDQWLYEVPYPTEAECKAMAKDYSYAECQTWFQTFYGKYLAGDTDTTKGKGFIATYEFYMTLNDISTQYIGAVASIDINKSNRSTVTAANFGDAKDVGGDKGPEQAAGIVREWNGWSIYEVQ